MVGLQAILGVREALEGEGRRKEDKGKKEGIKEGS